MLITEWCERGDIVAEGQREPFTYLEICTIVDQVAKALTWLHGKSFIHRALRPEYIIVRTRTDSVLEVCLSKLCFATEIPNADGAIDPAVAVEKASNEYYTEVGKRPAENEPYMAPDAFASHYDRRAEHLENPAAVDVWSLGVIALQLATGHLPTVVYENEWIQNNDPLRASEGTFARNLLTHKNRLALPPPEGEDWFELPLVMLIGRMMDSSPAGRITAKTLTVATNKYLEWMASDGHAKYPRGQLRTIRAPAITADALAPLAAPASAVVSLADLFPPPTSS